MGRVFYHTLSFIDRVGRIVAVLAGQPGGDYVEQLLNAHDAMKTSGTEAGLGKVSPEGPYLRGRFSAYNCGTTMRMGNSRPVLLNPKKVKPLLINLLENESIIRMARYQDCKSISRGITHPPLDIYIALS